MSSDPNSPFSPEPEPGVPPQSVPPLTTQPISPVGGSPAGTTGLAPNVAAGLSVLTGGIGGIVFLLLEKRDAFVRFWAMQSIFFGVAVIVLNIAVSIFLGILAHIIWFLAAILWFFYAIISLGILGVWVVMVIKSFGGKEWELPVLGKMAREQLAKLPPA